jgi:hypothetical protein
MSMTSVLEPQSYKSFIFSFSIYDQDWEANVSASSDLKDPFRFDSFLGFLRSWNDFDPNWLKRDW